MIGGMKSRKSGRQAALWVAAIVWSCVVVEARGQEPLTIRGPDGATALLPIDRTHGYAAVRWQGLERLGWVVEASDSTLRATTADGGAVVEFTLGNPLFRWSDDVLQLVDVPYMERGSAYVPLQFVLDFLPVRLGDGYAYSEGGRVLEIRDRALWAQGPSSVEAGPRTGQAEPSPLGRSDVPAPVEEASEASEARSETRVVVIDPGHGGRDPGSIGPGGRREKDVALAVGRALARELSGDETLEIHLTRDRDRLVPIWERGEMATRWKGERPGVFVSIHANALPGQPSVRGFETYFLSEARTEHERRVAANENAPLRMEGGVEGLEEGAEGDLGFILRELRNLDHQHWSSLLADGVQRELETIHPGPSRGVKQGPFAVITNALMPAVLVELGFLTNRDEERILSQDEFQTRLAGALARAIRDFFDRYPPGQAESPPGPRP